jgi:hypothetical protein
MYKTLALLFFLFGFVEFQAQRDTLARYGPGFRFQNGIYMDHQSFKDNCPDYLLTDLRDEEGKSMEEVDLSSRLYAYDAVSDSLIRVERDSIWGFSDRGQIYLQNMGYFDRLVVIGSICHIIHREEVIDYNAVYGVGVGQVPIRREIQVEYLVDMDTGLKQTFSPEFMLDIISDDPIVFRDYESLSARQRKQSKYLYLHRYNRENPIYFPLRGCRP